MTKLSKSKGTALFLIISFVIFISPWFLEALSKEKASLVGFVYDEDRTTPLEGAVIKIQNISTNKVQESKESDSLGIFRIQDIDEGFYIMGISTDKGDFNGDYIVAIKASETAKVSLALNPITQEEKEKSEKPRKKKGFVEFFLTPVGFFTIMGATALVAFGLAKLLEKEAETSPFKK